MNKEESNIEVKRKHSASHIMTAAAQMVFGRDIGLGVGPWTDTGFYQDYDFGEQEVSEKDLKKIEKKMRWIINKNMPIKRVELDEKEARKICDGDPYKTELLEDIVGRGEKISFYYIGESVENNISINLCAGPHLENTGDLGVFKVEKLAGSYWRGNEKNPMLTRIYGVAFKDEEGLVSYQHLLEEAHKRDHRKLGKELGLFTFSDHVGAGLPLFTPKGTLIRDLTVARIAKLQEEFGWQKVTIPHITKSELYKISGHWDQYKDDLFHVKGKSDTEFVMKPMNCPHHTQIYAAFPKSYKELPVRFAETTMVYRDEQAGELLGLSRVRAISQDDGHAFCRPDQIEQEVKNIVSIIKTFYTDLGMLEEGKYWVSLSVMDPKKPEKYLNENGIFERAQDILEKIAKDENLPYKRMEGEAAFYGPKLDFQFKDALGREWQLGTVQLDFSMPKRFELEYTDEHGKRQTPVMIHRAIAGSLERFMSVMIEHFAGAFPLWLSPEQVRILPIADAHAPYAAEVYEILKKSGLRTELDDSSDTLGKKIRNVKTQKVPYFIVIGDDEVQNKTITAESRDTHKKESMSTEELITKLQKEIG